MPERLKPPKGVQYRTDEWLFTDRLPASIPRAARSARPTSRVQIEPESPNEVSLAMEMASASSSKGITTTTGPKISSVTTAAAGSTGASTVGGNQKPGPVGQEPRKATGAPSGTNEVTTSSWELDTSGPISVDSSVGSPTTTPATAGSSNSINRSYALRSTRILDRAQQSCPALSKTP